MKTIYYIALALFMVNTPTVTWACGGFFCNASLPVTQSAERILFAHRDGQIDMHVQIQYQGPPTEFGWILPAVRGVETSISSEALFTALDRIYGPRFNLSYDYDEACFNDEIFLESEEFLPTQGGGDMGSQPPPPEPQVQVISREVVGPYDRVILDAPNVDLLRGWLNDNEFNIPESIDEKLQPYIDADLIFVAIKLLAGNDSGDIVPLRLNFSGDRPSIPILPTAVAADPDMGIIVHILGTSRAIPLNYNHVQINEALIDWGRGGSNYPSVVSQAADEAEGKAFATDFAGPVGDQLTNALTPYSEALLTQIEEATTLDEFFFEVPDRRNPDFVRVINDLVEVPEGIDRDEFLSCPQCFEVDSVAIDGAQVAARLRMEVNSVYESIGELVEALPYMTRLYTTLSPEEMDTDPLFSLNPDLEDVSSTHNATVYVSCNEDGETESEVLTLSDGRSFPFNSIEPLVRQEGERVRGEEDMPASVVIERMFEAGQSEPVTTRTPQELDPNQLMVTSRSPDLTPAQPGPPSPSPSTPLLNEDEGGDRGCQQRGEMMSPSLLIGFGLFVLFRRRRVLEYSFYSDDAGS